ncbi:MAG: DNA mismatch repair protein MutS, partial [Prevotella sp.]|nr:DNA mismatch repair protein MutS [Prevotella sp.]
MAKSGLTPMMQQFFDLKAKHPDALMLFRCGDFYETYCEDAEIAAKILGITLTRRSSVAGTSASGTAMAGFPHHALDTYLPKLIRAGKRVAICDQLEDPKLTKKLVKRGITELVTPGVAIGDNVLQPQENNFLSAIHFGKAACGVAFLDISTGEFLVSEGTYDYVAKLLSDFSPKEVLYEKGRHADFLRNLSTANSQLSKYCVYELDDWAFNEAVAKERLLKHFSVKNLKGFGVEHLKNGITAAGAVMQYLDITQHTQTSHITAISRIEEEKYVRLDSFTSRNLELVRPMSSDGVSLLDIINKTVTPMGGRTMHRWLLFPLKNVNHINERLDVVDYFFRHPDFRSVINENFALVGDIERIISKVAIGRVTPREVLQLRNALRALEPVKSACEATEDEKLKSIGKQLDCCISLCERIENELNSDAPAQIAKGDVIATGYNAELDELRQISHGGKDYLLQIQQREIEKTGISSLKIGFNNVFGYYIEVRNTYKEQVPEDWIRKQTLAQAERYITQELKEYEDQILGAEDKIAAMEVRLFGELVADMNQFIPSIQRDAVVVAQIDCLHAFAMVAEENHYIRPIMDESTIIDIHQGRHPVIERQLPSGESYVPNDVLLDNNSQQIMIITGPNMAGKSALLRQTALITIMAQMGCFVPAESARIGV